MSIKKVDPNSEEFQEELKKTIKFTDKVVKQFGFVYNPEKEINEGIQFGLTRNKLIYGKRFCPCFFVQQDEEGKFTKDNRICPCKPALDTEVKNDGRCHCQIYCTSEYADSVKKKDELEEAVHEHSRGLSKDECETLLAKQELDGDELESLMEAREKKMVTFNLVDTREWMEYKTARIKETDHLIPTTSFYDEIKKIESEKDTPVIVYCHTGSRSAYCQRVLLDLGFKQVSNLTFGIVAYHGEIERG